MLNYLKKEADKTYTENGAVTYRSTGSECLNLFATIGALRNCDDQEVISRFTKAYAENRNMALKILFFGRDIRGGLGERRVFRTIVRWLAFYDSGAVLKNMEYIAVYGRYDDLLVLLGTPCEDEVVALMKKQFEVDLNAMEAEENVSLLAKWMPSVNASNANTVRNAKRLAKRFDMSYGDYRKALSKLRAYIKIIENNLREKDYTFEYSAQPSRALLKYRAAFWRNDSERYSRFLKMVGSGEVKMNTGTVTPYDIIRPIYDVSAWGVREVTSEERQSLDTAWNNLENFTSDENALVVLDTSSSMYYGREAVPAAVAESLAIYFAERNTGIFHNHFINFSMTPQMLEIKGRDIVDKVTYLTQFNEVANTDLKKVFNLLLKTAKKYDVKPDEMPSRLYIISDMEFDNCMEGADITNFEYAKKAFINAGYELPQIVFWNVNSRTSQQPVKQNEQGVTLISGGSPRVFDMVMNDRFSPYESMMEIISSERYAKIAA